MPPLALSALLAFIGYSVLNISQAVQKIGLNLAQRSRTAGYTLWATALLASGVSFAIVFVAITIGRVSVVGAMAGTGLVSLSIFSRLALGETLNRSKLLSITAILLGAIGVALFSRAGETGVRTVLLWSIPAGAIGAGVLAWILLPRGRMLGVVLGAFSGFLGSYSQLFQREVAVALPEAASLLEIAGHLVGNPVNLVWIGLSFASMVVIQFAYSHNEATRIIPAFTGVFIVTPVVGGVVVFGESLSAIQWIGVAVILVGTLHLTRD